METTFLTVDEIAQMLQINPQTVRNWIDAGKLKAVRVGSRRVRIRESELERFLAEGEANLPRTEEDEDTEESGSWTQFGAQLMEVTSASGRDDVADLASALEGLAQGAAHLARVLRERAPHAGSVEMTSGSGPTGYPDRE